MRKSSSKSTATPFSKRDILRSILPNGVLRWCLRMRMVANRRPRKTVGVILSLVSLNVAFVFYLSEKSRQQAFSYTSISPGKLVGQQIKALNVQAGDIPFTWKNYQQVSALKDSLEYLMNKTNRNAEDTLLFIRIFERYARLDPAFAKAILKGSPPSP